MKIDDNDIKSSSKYSLGFYRIINSLLANMFLSSVKVK